MKILYFITKNQEKILAAKNVFDTYGIELKTLDEEFSEIQADTSLEIARHTAIAASNATNLPIIREDHSLYIHSLGFPGPYTAFIEKRMSAEKLLKILNLYEDRTGYFEVSTVCAIPHGKIFEYSYHVPIYFKKEETIKDPRGGWNGILCLKGETRAFTEYPKRERSTVWNKNYIKIAEELSKS